MTFLLSDSNLDERKGFLAKWFAPKLSQYPKPTSLGSIDDVAISVARVRTILEALAIGLSQSAPVLVPSVIPLTVVPISLTKRTFRAWSHNPEFVGPDEVAWFEADGDPRKQPTKEDLLSMFLDSRTIDGAPVTFTVPRGCDSIELLTGPIEVVPGVGAKEDLELPAFAGRARVLIDGTERKVDRLEPGERITVIIPWRASGTIALPVGRLRQLVRVHFFQSDTPSQTATK